MLYFKKISKLVIYFISISFFIQNNSTCFISNSKNPYSNSIALASLLNYENKNTENNTKKFLENCDLDNCSLNILFSYFKNKYKDKYNTNIEIEIKKLKILNHLNKILESRKKFVYISDIDGTILKEGDSFENKLYEPFLQTLEDLASLGTKIVLITGGGCDEKKQTVVTPIINFFKKHGKTNLLNHIRIYFDGAARYINLDKVDVTKKEINGSATNLPNKIPFKDSDISKIKQLLIEESENKFGINSNDIELWNRYYECTKIQNGVKGGLTIPWAIPNSPIEYKKSPLVQRKRNDENNQPIPCILNKEYFQLSVRCLPPCKVEGFYDGFVKKKALENKFTLQEIQRLTQSAKTMRYMLFEKIKKLFPDKIIFWQSTYVIHICVANKEEALEHALTDKSFIGNISRDKVDTIYFGNEFYEGGNDRPIIEQGKCAVNIGPLKIEHPLENLMLYNSNIEDCHKLISDIKNVIFDFESQHINIRENENFIDLYIQHMLNLPYDIPKQIMDILKAYVLKINSLDHITFPHPLLSKKILSSM
jgi:hypothetical protein